MDISVLLGFQKLSILISSQTRWVAVNPYMTCRLYDIDVYTYDHKCIQITILTSNFHLYTSFTHACPSDSHCNDSAKRWYNLPWLSVAPCTACNSENCPPQPRASWPSTFQIISAANWIFQNRESEHDVSRIILSQNGFRRRLFYMVGFWDPCGNQGTRSGSIPWPSWTVWSFMGMLAFLEVKHASFEASPFPARWRNSFHNSSWIEGGTSWNLVASGTLKIFWRSSSSSLLRSSRCTWVALAKVRTKACASLMPISGCRGSSWTGTCCSKVQQKAEKRGNTPRLSRFLTDSFGSWLVSDHFPQIQMVIPPWPGDPCNTSLEAVRQDTAILEYIAFLSSHIWVSHVRVSDTHSQNCRVHFQLGNRPNIKPVTQRQIVRLVR